MEKVKEVVRVRVAGNDEKGKTLYVRIPPRIRDAVGLDNVEFVSVEVTGDRKIIVTPLENV